MTLVFVRHGQSVGNARGVIQGWADFELSDEGKRDAEAVAQRLAGVSIAAVYSSDLVRARDTGLAIARPHGIPVEQRRGLRERHWGEAEGLTRPEIAEGFGPDARTGVGRITGEEVLPALRERVVSELTELSRRHPEDIAVVATHNGIILAILAHVLGLSPDLHPPIELANGGLTVIETAPALRIRAVNDAGWSGA